MEISFPHFWMHRMQTLKKKKELLGTTLETKGKCPSSNTYSWSISHILEHEFFCLGHLGSSGSKEKSNVLKSGTLLSAAPERHSQNQERRRSATPFFQKEQCGSGTHIFEESENMSAPLFPLFFFLLFPTFS
jgi:hypothetical protein